MATVATSLDVNLYTGRISDLPGAYIAAQGLMDIHGTLCAGGEPVVDATAKPVVGLPVVVGLE
jgi:hypothetical protein